MRADQKRITADLPAELWAQVKKKAIDQRRTLSRLVREVLVNYIQEQKNN